jgi:5-enolpyruvylshikimate-3-phosphate synthase
MVDSHGRLGFRAKVDAAAEEITVQGLGGVVPSAGARLHAGNAGTVARFLTALVALGKGDASSTGSPGCASGPSLTWWKRSDNWAPWLIARQGVRR